MSAYIPFMRDERDRAFFSELGLRLKELRKDQNITQIVMSERLNISQQVYASYEVGRLRLPASLLPEIARILGVGVEELLGVTSPKQKRGPAPKLQKQIEAVAELPKSKQKFVSDFLETVLSQAS